MNTYVKTLMDNIGNQLFPRTRIDAVYLLDNTTKLDAELDARDERLADPKATPVDADFTGIRDSADANKLKKITWAQIKAALKSYFDTLYNNYTLPTASTTVLGGVKVDGTSITISGGVISADEVNTTTLGATINGAATKATPVDADSIGLVDSAASNVIKKLTWANVKSTLKTYFDTLYNNYTHPTGDGNLHVPANSTTNNNRVLKANSTAGSYAWTDLGVVVSGLTAKSTPVNADSVMVVDSAASNVGKKTTFTELKAFYKTYFDTLYQAILVSGTNIKSVNGNTLLGSGNLALEDVIIVALSDETTALTTGTAKATFRMPYACKLTTTLPRASVNTVSSSGIVTVDINKNGTSILTNKLTIDANEKTSVTAAIATTLVSTPTTFASDDEITMDIDVAGTGAKGLKVALYVERT